MADGNQFQLLRERRFMPFFLTQALGAFNDNVFKNALVILVAFLTTQLSVADVNFYTNLAAALFILPFLLFSATSGQFRRHKATIKTADRIAPPMPTAR